jgi:hypothetical protein
VRRSSKKNLRRITSRNIKSHDPSNVMQGDYDNGSDLGVPAGRPADSAGWLARTLQRVSAFGTPTTFHLSLGGDFFCDGCVPLCSFFPIAAHVQLCLCEPSVRWALRETNNDPAEGCPADKLAPAWQVFTCGDPAAGQRERARRESRGARAASTALAADLRRPTYTRLERRGREPEDVAFLGPCRRRVYGCGGTRHY